MQPNQSLESWVQDNLSEPAVEALQKRLNTKRAQALAPLVEPMRPRLRFPPALVQFLIQLAPRSYGIPARIHEGILWRQFANAQLRLLTDCAIVHYLQDRAPAHAIHEHLVGDLKRGGMQWAIESLQVLVPSYFKAPSLEQQERIFHAAAVYFGGTGSTPAACLLASERCRKDWNKRLKLSTNVPWMGIMLAMDDICKAFARAAGLAEDAPVLAIAAAHQGS